MQYKIFGLWSIQTNLALYIFSRMICLYLWSACITVSLYVVFVLGERVLCFHGPLLYEAKVGYYCKYPYTEYNKASGDAWQSYPRFSHRGNN